MLTLFRILIHIALSIQDIAKTLLSTKLNILVIVY